MLTTHSGETDHDHFQHYTRCCRTGSDRHRQGAAHEAVKERALACCDWAVSMDLVATRTLVDICDDRLVAVEALLKVRNEITPYVDLQLVSQDGLSRSPNARENIIRALEMGVNVVGRIPHFEHSMADRRRSVTELCEIAAERGLMMDLHCDATDDPHSRHIEQLAHESHRLGLHGRVADSHLTSMRSMDNYYVPKLLPLIAEAGVSAIPNPLINIMLQGRDDTYPKRRGLTRVPEMLKVGIRTGWGRIACVIPGTRSARPTCSTSPSWACMSPRCPIRRTCVRALIWMGLDHLGLEVGKTASLVVLDAGNPIEAVHLRAERVCVIARGKVVAEREKRETVLSIKGRPATINRRHFVPRQPWVTNNTRQGAQSK